MRIRSCRLLRHSVLLGVWLLPARLAFGQAADDTASTATSAPWHFGFFVAAGHRSPDNSFLGRTPGRDHLIVGIQALTPILRAGALRMSYGAQLLPMTVVRGRSAPLGYTGTVDADGLLLGPDLAYAVGVSPFGVEIGAPVGAGVELFGAAAAGGLIFTRPFPVPEAQRVNFTLEYGGGLVLRTGSTQRLRLGYKYHHLSNAYYGHVNPGLDANMFYAGYEWSRRLPR